MKILSFFNYCFLIAVTSLVFVSCKKNDPVAPNELEGLRLVTTLNNDNHTIELYTANGKLQTGYNAIFFQIKNGDGSLVNNATASWMPVMSMMSMSHSCPASAIAKKAGAASTYGGFIIFQMAGSEMEYWELMLEYTIGGVEYSAEDKIQVEAAPKRVVESFQGSDEKRYVLALVEPGAPRVALNDMSAALYRMESMMSFVPVEDYTVKIDPRMPGMGNHGSPNNIDLTEGSDKLYHGKLSLTMTGYWKINLQVENDAATILKGEPVTEANEGSSIYFELEF